MQLNNVFISLIGKSQDYMLISFFIAYCANLHLHFHMEFASVITKHCKNIFDYLLGFWGLEKGYVGCSYYLFLQMLVKFSDNL